MPIEVSVSLCLSQCLILDLAIEYEPILLGSPLAGTLTINDRLTSLTVNIHSKTNFRCCFKKIGRLSI